MVWISITKVYGRTDITKVFVAPSGLVTRKSQSVILALDFTVISKEIFVSLLTTTLVALGAAPAPFSKVTVVPGPTVNPVPVISTTSALGLEKVDGSTSNIVIGGPGGGGGAPASSLRIVPTGVLLPLNLQSVQDNKLTLNFSSDSGIPSPITPIVIISWACPDTKVTVSL